MLNRQATRFIFRALLIIICLSVFMGKTNADTIYLKNGRSIEGFIKAEDADSIELEIEFGKMGIKKNQIERIYNSTPEESQIIIQKWQRHQLQREMEAQEARVKEEFAPKQVELAQESGHIFVEALLNKKVSVQLLLDTGASWVLLSNNIAKKLDIDINDKEGIVQLQLADGRKINARYTLLEHISVQGIEAENVEAAILLEDVAGMAFKDGLLGMSFLNRFNFKVDQNKKHLILEKLK